jgi:hypothetical protein
MSQWPVVSLPKILTFSPESPSVLNRPRGRWQGVLLKLAGLAEAEDFWPLQTKGTNELGVRVILFDFLSSGKRLSGEYLDLRELK